MLDLKAEPQDVVTLDNYVQPVDRGPAVDAKLLSSWQFKATGKLATAAVLRDLKVEKIRTGEFMQIFSSLVISPLRSLAAE